MRRPLSVTLLALGLGWFSFVATLGGLAGLLMSLGYGAPLAPGLCATLFLAGVLGLRATGRMWRRRADAPKAIRAFTLVGAFLPVWIYVAFPPKRRSEVVWPAALGTAVFVGVGLLTARRAAAASSVNSPGHR